MATRQNDGRDGTSSRHGLDWRKNQFIHQPEELEALCDRYFQDCAEQGKRPTKPGLILALDISESTFNEWCGANGDKLASEEKRRLAAELKKALLRIQDDLEQGKDPMSIFRLKQPCYGGFSDRTDERGGGALTVKVSFGTRTGGGGRTGK